MMIKNVTCDKCGHEFTVNQADFKEIRRNDIIVQYFSCPMCFTKYNVCTTNPKMRRLIRKRLDIQNEIASCNVKPVSARKAHRIQAGLDKVTAQQEKLLPELRRRGEKILNGGD